MASSDDDHHSHRRRRSTKSGRDDRYEKDEVLPAQGGFLELDSSASKSPGPKRIIICCDGTWQSSTQTKDNVPSNVTRLARSIARTGYDSNGRKWQQLVYYHSGIGSGEISHLEAIRQGAFGEGLVTNVIDAYSFIVNNWSPGDKILCFGFSRGAYTARAVAGLVTDIGVMKPSDMDEFPALYRAYQQNNKGDNFRVTNEYHDWIKGVKKNEFGGNHHQNYLKMRHGVETTGRAGQHPDLERVPDDYRTVEVVGVFDTVGALGIPDTRLLDLSEFRKAHGFHNVKLSPHIKRAFHALALDEHRAPFSPTLWYIPYDRPDAPSLQELQRLKEDIDHVERGKYSRDEKLRVWRRYQKAKLAYDFQLYDRTDLKQVWFPGVHINIGGGNSDGLKTRLGDLEQIANITFSWMADLLRPYLTLNDDTIQLDHFNRYLRLEQIAVEKDDGKNNLPPVILDMLAEMGITKPHRQGMTDAIKYGWAVGPIVDSYKIIYPSKTRTPGRYSDENGVRLSTLGDTNEYIHPCVRYRILNFRGPQGYNPQALAGFKCRKRTRPNGAREWQWAKYTDDDHRHDIYLKEWIMRPGRNDNPRNPADTYERLTIKMRSARQFLYDMDQLHGFKVPPSSLIDESQIRPSVSSRSRTRSIGSARGGVDDNSDDSQHSGNTPRTPNARSPGWTAVVPFQGQMPPSPPMTSGAPTPFQPVISYPSQQGQMGYFDNPPLPPPQPLKRGEAAKYFDPNETFDSTNLLAVPGSRPNPGDDGRSDGSRKHRHSRSRSRHHSRSGSPDEEEPKSSRRGHSRSHSRYDD